MRTNTNLGKATIALAVAAFVVVPAALATPRDGRSPDTRDAALTAQQHLAVAADVRSPDTRDAALTAQQHLAVAADVRSPDTRDAARAAQHLAAPADGRSPDTRDAARAARSTPDVLLTALLDRRSPDTIDAAIATQVPDVTVIHPHGFQWVDFGIGAIAAFSAVLFLALSIKLIAARQNGKQPHSVATP